MSGATSDLVIESLPENAWLTKLGSHRLRDLTRPERVAQLCHPDLHIDFPPLASAVTAGVNTTSSSIGPRRSNRTSLTYFWCSPPTARDRPKFSERSDVLTLMLQARYEDGSPISDDHIADELLTLLAAGHETTATTLAWAVERLRRHPRLLARLAAEVDEGMDERCPAESAERRRHAASS